MSPAMGAITEKPPPPHFLVATFPFQGHISPTLHLAKHIARTAGAMVTFSTSTFAHRRMFPSSASVPGYEVHDGLLSYVPYSDGVDDDGNPDSPIPEYHRFMDKYHRAGSRSFAEVVESLAARGRPVTCIIYTLLLPWAADVASEHGIPSVHYWIQPAAVLAMYYHYFHGYGSIVDAHRDEPSFPITFPGMPPLTIGDLPSFLTIPEENAFYDVFTTLRDTFEVMRREEAKPKVLVNTFDALEVDVLESMSTDIVLIAIAPLLPSAATVSETSVPFIFKPDEKRYMEWLDSKPERSVVYISFGSLHKSGRRQAEEMLSGLQESGRPYLWVVRRDSREEGIDLEKGGNGMVVQWCDQVEVLRHPSVGCFVTHFGWNSTLESLALGVPMVGAPKLSDQMANARMVENVWRTGVRAEIDGEGVMEGKELRRCLELVMGQGDRGVEIRRSAATWMTKAREAAGAGGSSDRNLRKFLEGEFATSVK